MGLFLCKLLIDLHKGDIKIDSEKGKGTKILVSLPIDDNIIKDALNKAGETNEITDY